MNVAFSGKGFGGELFVINFFIVALGKSVHESSAILREKSPSLSPYVWREVEGKVWMRDI